MQIDDQLILITLYTVLLPRFMDKNKILGRRNFIKTVAMGAAGVGTAALTGQSLRADSAAVVTPPSPKQDPHQAILFLDNWLIEKQVGLERVWGKPRFVKEVFHDFHPRVLGYGGYASMFWDERVGKYVLYAAVYPPEADPGTFVIRLESDSPYEWADPIYDATVTPAWKGFQQVVVDEKGERFWPIYINTLAGTPQASRGYLMSTYHPDRQIHQSIAGYSADGRHFDMRTMRSWQSARADTWCGWIWNSRAGVYQIHTRPTHVDRRIAIITSRDLENFTPATTVLQPDAIDGPGTEFYSMPAKAYEGMFIGLLHVFDTDAFEEANRVKMAGRVQTQLTYSYNGFNWYRGERTPFVPTREYGQLGGGQVYAMDMLRTKEDKLLFLVEGTKGEHASYPDMQKAGIDTRGAFGPLLYELRLDGFCSMKTRSKDGLLRTKTIIPQSAAISINVRTSTHTAVRVQLLDGVTGLPLPGYTLAEAVPISGDHLFARPQWKGASDLAKLVGKPIRIEIMMREAELFAIRVACHIFVGTESTVTL